MIGRTGGTRGQGMVELEEKKMFHQLKDLVLLIAPLHILRPYDGSERRKEYGSKGGPFIHLFLSKVIIHCAVGYL